MAGGMAMDGGKESAGLWSSPWKASLVAELGERGEHLSSNPSLLWAGKHFGEFGAGAHGHRAQVEARWAKLLAGRTDGLPNRGQVWPLGGAGGGRTL